MSTSSSSTTSTQLQQSTTATGPPRTRAVSDPAKVIYSYGYRGIVHVPDSSVKVEDAISRVTHLAIGGHPDDIEFMALKGIIECYESKVNFFGGVCVTDGGGSPRCGDYAEYTDEDIRRVRLVEQNKAADVGKFSVMWQLQFKSEDIKDPTSKALETEILKILRATKPKVVYTHNPTDKHDTHIAVMFGFLRAVRSLPVAERPPLVIGCEMWRDLDWLCDEDRLMLDISGHTKLAEELNNCFPSQIASGKKYDKAIMGRRDAHATFFSTHKLDFAEQLTFALDMTPLVMNDDLDAITFAMRFIDHFRDNVRARLSPHVNVKNQS